MTLLHTFEQGAISWLSSPSAIIEVIVGARLRTDIALHVKAAATRTCHFIATFLFNKRSSALITLPNQGGRHGLLDLSSDTEPIIFGVFLARLRDV